MKSEDLPDAYESVKLGGLEKFEIEKLSLESLVVYCSQLLLKRRGNVCLMAEIILSINILLLRQLLRDCETVSPVIIVSASQQ